MHTLTLWLALAGAAPLAPPPANVDHAAPPWQSVESVSFQIQGQASIDALTALARHCEQLRGELRRCWLGAADGTPWNPRCQIVLHATAADLQRALGFGPAETSGAASFDVRAGRVVRRRVDLLLEPQPAVPTALAHELTHVVLADRFCHWRIPPWADEGVAVLSESPADQARHRQAVQRAWAAERLFSLDQLFALADCPCNPDRPVFYGQSHSLVQYLAGRAPPERFIEFVDRAHREGYDRALQAVYGIRGVGELEQQWRASLSGEPPSTTILVQTASH